MAEAKPCDKLARSAGEFDTLFRGGVQPLLMLSDGLRPLEPIVGLVLFNVARKIQNNTNKRNADEDRQRSTGS